MHARISPQPSWDAQHGSEHQGKSGAGGGAPKEVAAQSPPSYFRTSYRSVEFSTLNLGLHSAHTLKSAPAAATTPPPGHTSEYSPHSAAPN